MKVVHRITVTAHYVVDKIGFSCYTTRTLKLKELK